MGLFSWLFGKKPIDRVEGGEVEIPAENMAAENPIPKEQINEKPNDELEQEKKEGMKRFIARISALIERVELLERKMDRVEGRLGIRDETEKDR